MVKRKRSKAVLPYDFEKSLTENSKHMTKIRKKYKKHVFFPGDLVGYD